jgi:hypothetical protein
MQNGLLAAALKPSPFKARKGWRFASLKVLEYWSIGEKGVYQPGIWHSGLRNLNRIKVNPL